MTYVPPFKPDRFSSAVPFYRAYRLRYPARLVDEVARRVALPSGGRVLDLGCGPGFLAIAFAQAGCTVIGLDPDPAMLAAARIEAAEAGVEVDFRQGSSYDLSPALGPFDLVTMGRSFHWMDRPATLRILDGLVAPRGALALFGDEHERTGENAWHETVKATTEELAPAATQSQWRRGTAWTGHVAVLLDSVFCDVDRYGLWERRSLSVDDAVGRALSMSSSAPDALGEKRDAFEATLRDRLAALAPLGQLTEVVEFYAIMARRR